MIYFQGWTFDQNEMTATAPDGCIIEIDGECPHGMIAPFDLLV